MQVTLDHVEDIAQNIKTFWFKPEKSLRHVAGQFIELTIPHDNADKRGQKRWFTLSDSRMYSKPLVCRPFCCRGRLEKSWCGIGGQRGSSGAIGVGVLGGGGSLPFG